MYFLKGRSLYMANTVKMTKKDYFKALLAIEEVKANSAMVDFINHEIELLEKKNSNRKPSKAQAENENIKEFILDKMAENVNQLFTATEIMKAIQPSVEIELTNQKVSALLRQLVADNMVKRVEDKRKTYFQFIG